jgi:precorrin-2/cobalt-factor-2 C20-methyltransferase
VSDKIILGTLYGIGVGPGDPALMTVKGASLLGECRHLFVPKARTEASSLALSIAKPYLREQADIHELVFPMSADEEELSAHWRKNASEINDILLEGSDACFITLGDPFLYSTFIYLVRELRSLRPSTRIVSVPGVTAFSAAASLCAFPVGEGRDGVTIIPAVEDLDHIRRVLKERGTVILMKIGKRLREVIDLLEEEGVMDGSVFVSRVGMADQRLETNLLSLRDAAPETGYLSIILVHATGK